MKGGSLKTMHCASHITSILTSSGFESGCNEVLARLRRDARGVVRTPEVLLEFSGGPPGVLKGFSEGSPNPLGGSEAATARLLLVEQVPRPMAKTPGDCGGKKI